MSSIDDRIVSIKFDNASFEANIKTTLGSLEALKKSLNFGSAIKGLADLDKAGKSINIKVDNASFDASVKATLNSAKNLQDGLKMDGIVDGLNEVDRAAKNIKFKLDPKMFQDGVKAVQEGASRLKESLNFENIKTNFSKIDFKSLNFQSVIDGAGRARTAIANIDREAVFNNLKGAAQSVVGHLGQIQSAAQKVDLNTIGSSIDDIRGRFSGLEIAGIAALGAIGAKAAAVGAGMAKSMMLDGPKAGLAEYETNLNSIQTILANTQSKGSTLGDVNKALAELNNYSDKTIYNFSEMARNIGTFTAAGVSLDTSTEAIKGISNLAALSGSNSQQASTAMYQLSQAMSTGKVSLMDWNSVVNAGMGGEVFQESLKETARNQGIAIDGLIEQNGSFRDSLQEGWLTTDVMTETLSKLTGDLTDDQLRSMGYQDDMIVKIQQTAKTANDAATKVKTFSQLVGTLQETSGSGWSVTMQTILGDFEEAKAMWTAVNNELGSIVSGSADRRNAMLGEWKEDGGRTAMINSVANAYKALMGIVTPIGEAFRTMFPPMTGKRLADITRGVEAFTAALIPGNATMGVIKGSFLLLFGILKIGVTIIQGVLTVFGALIKGIFTGGKSVGESGQKFSEFAARIGEVLSNSTFIQEFFSKVAEGARLLGTGIAVVIGAFVSLVVGIATFVASSGAFQSVIAFIGKNLMALPDHVNSVLTALGVFGAGILTFFSALGAGVGGFIEGGFDVAMTRVRERLESFGRLGESLVRLWDGVKSSAADLWAKLEPLRTAFADMFRDIGDSFKDVLQDVDFNDILDLVNVGLLGGLVLLFKNFFKKGLGIGDDLKSGILDKLGDSLGGIKDVLKGLTGTLEAMQQNLQADTLMKIAMAIGVLAASVVVLSLIDSGKLTKALVAIGVMFVMLNKSMAALDQISVGSGFIKMPFIAASMILLATAILILAASVTVLSKLSWGELVKGLAGVSVMLMATAKAAEVMSRNPANLIATGLGLIALAAAIKILASAVEDFSDLSWGEMIQGLVGVGAVLGALLIFNNTAKVSAGALANAAGLVLLGVALKLIASAVSDFGDIAVSDLVQGMITLGLVLTMLNNFTKGATGAEGMIKTAAAMVILGAALHVIAGAVEKFGSMDFGTLAKGLTAMAISLGLIVAAMNLMPPGMLGSALALTVVAASLIVLGVALRSLGGMTWEEIAKGLITLAVALGVIAVALNLMVATLPGSAALVVAAAALAILTPVLMLLASLTWTELLIGLSGLAAIFLILGVAGLVLAPVTPVILALGLAIQALGLGLLGIGAGTLMFTFALIALAGAAATAGPVLVTFVTSLLHLIPLALEQLAIGIVRFAEVISGAGPVFLVAMTTLIMTLLTAIQVLAPEIANTLATLITTLLDLLLRSVPEFVDKGLQLVTGILRGIASNLPGVINAATDVIVNFLNGLANNMPRITASGVNLIIALIQGIQNNAPRLMQAGAELIISLVQSLANTIRGNQAAMSAAGRDLAWAIADGLTGGLASKAGELASKAANFAKGALDAAKNALGIASPSKEFTKVGKWSGEGMIQGLVKMGGAVNRASARMGRNALNALRKSMSDVATVATLDIDSQPTIRPVLDLSDIKANAPIMDKLLKAPTLQVSGTLAQASIVATERQLSREAEFDAMNKRTEIGGTVIMNQYNTSPKALDNVEIYRRTNSQISIAKGVLTKNAPRN